MSRQVFLISAARWARVLVLINKISYKTKQHVGIKHVSDCMPTIIVPKIFLQEKAAETT